MQTRFGTHLYFLPMTMVLGLFGSGEFLPWAQEVDRFLLDRARSGDGSAVVIPTASAPEGEEVFQSWIAKGLRHYESMSVPARFAPLRTREDAEDPATLESIEGASLLYFSGGNPAFLASTLRDTPFWKSVMKAIENGVAVAGCSAGACIFGEQAPDPTKISDVKEAFRPRGLSVIPGVAFGAHWDMLDSYYPGLRRVALDAVPPDQFMVGLDEDTAIVSEGSDWRVFGKGAVSIYRDRDNPKIYRAGETLTL